MLEVISLPTGIPIRILNDGLTYPLGTKARVTDQYVRLKCQEGVNEFVYVSSAETVGGYALAQSAIKQGAQATLFLSGTRLPPQGRGIKARINIIGDSISNIEITAEQYVRDHPNSLKVPFGIHDQVYINLLKDNLLADPEVLSLNGSRIWLAVGSGALLSVLLEVLPQSTFIAVQVGKYIPKYLSDNPRVTTFISPEKFTRPARIRPPFKALANYDAKVWSWVLKYGQVGDAIWIVY